MQKELNLDVAIPDEALDVLSAAADEYRVSASDLETSWQDPGAARPWDIIADELDKAVARIEKRLKKTGYPLR